MTTTVKLDENGKTQLEKLQAKLRLTSDLKIDQFRLLRELIYFGDSNFEDFLCFLQGVPLTDEEVKKINEKFIKPYSHHYPDKSDDELLYGGNR
ncbi:MAG: hypothetical protein KAT16_08875 [Candidatus Heimdallarchaeota archaeon]|nr:hypothetical protein [Candidatus Heimdallarchaeota archaeon]